MGKKKNAPDLGFGRRLRELRERAGLTQQQLAAKADCHSVHVSRLEGGVREPAWSLVVDLARALGVDCTAFLPDGKPQPAEHRPRGRPRKSPPPPPEDQG